MTVCDGCKKELITGEGDTLSMEQFAPNGLRVVGFDLHDKARCVRAWLRHQYPPKTRGVKVETPVETPQSAPEIPKDAAKVK